MLEYTKPISLLVRTSGGISTFAILLPSSSQPNMVNIPATPAEPEQLFAASQCLCHQGLPGCIHSGVENTAQALFYCNKLQKKNLALPANIDHGQWQDFINKVLNKTNTSFHQPKGRSVAHAMFSVELNPSQLCTRVFMEIS